VATENGNAIQHGIETTTYGINNMQTGARWSPTNVEEYKNNIIKKRDAENKYGIFIYVYQKL
jgi:hypothetical protein